MAVTWHTYPIFSLPVFVKDKLCQANLISFDRVTGIVAKEESVAVTYFEFVRPLMLSHHIFVIYK